jgi:hypothetical protein
MATKMVKIGYLLFEANKSMPCIAENWLRAKNMLLSTHPQVLGRSLETRQNPCNNLSDNQSVSILPGSGSE